VVSSTLAWTEKTPIRPVRSRRRRTGPRRGEAAASLPAAGGAADPKPDDTPAVPRVRVVERHSQPGSGSGHLQLVHEPWAEPAFYYPWSVLWRATDTSDHVRAIVSCAQTMSRRLGWLVAPRQPAH
jgi:hypothetical protein